MPAASGHPASLSDILLAGRPAATVENQCIESGIPGGGWVIGAILSVIRVAAQQAR